MSYEICDAYEKREEEEKEKRTREIVLLKQSKEEKREEGRDLMTQGHNARGYMEYRDEADKYARGMRYAKCEQLEGSRRIRMHKGTGQND